MEKACYTMQLKKNVSANQVTAEPKAITYQPPTDVPTRMVRVDSSMTNYPTVQPQSTVVIDGNTINLDEAPKPIPPMWI